MTTDPLSRLAAYGLRSRTGPVLIEPVTGTTWTELLAAMERHRLLGVAAAAIDDDVLAVTDDQHDDVRHRFEARMTACMALERQLVEVDDLLARASVPIRVLKGPALAHGVALEPRQRTFGDIDLLVPTGRLDRAVAVLTEAGATRPVPPLTEDFDRRFAKSVTLTRGPFEVDLHRTLAAGPFGMGVDQSELWAEPDSFTVAGRSFATLDRERHLVHACYHAVLGDVAPRLSSLRDIALLAEHPQLDHRQVLALAASWGGEAVLAEGMNITREALPGRTGPLYEWAHGRDPSRPEVRALRAYRTERRRFARQSVATLRAIPRRRDRIAYVRAVLWPSKAHLRGRGLSRIRHLVRR